MWNDFDANKEKLAQQFQERHWNQYSGHDAAALREECAALEQRQSGMPKPLVKANIFEYIMHNAQIEVHALDWFADQINHGNIISEIRNAWMDVAYTENKNNEAIRIANARNNLAFTGDVDFGHTSPDWDFLMVNGLTGIIARIENEISKKENDMTLTDSQKIFYESCRIVYHSVVHFVTRLSHEAKRLSRGNDRMAVVAESLLHIAEGAPQTMLEAMQLTLVFYFLQTNVEGTIVRSIGNLDRLYYRFFVSDIASGKYTKEQIREILKHFLYRFYAAKIGSNLPFSLSGCGADGRDVTNELSYLIAETYDELSIESPKIHICCNNETPDDFLKMIMRIIKRGNNSFVFVNDDVVVQSLRSIGEDAHDARKYVMVGCYEPMALGKEVPCTCNGRLNIPKAVEYAMNCGIDFLSGETAGCATPDPGTFTDFEAFYAAVKQQLLYFSQQTMAVISELEKKYGEVHPSPLFSATMSECVERGMDAYTGGAKYNNSSINAFGLATAADSLYAIRKAVFEDNVVSLTDLKAILLSDWEYNKKLYTIIKKRYPKYGNNNDAVDFFAQDLVKYISSCISNKPNGRNGVFRAGFFSIDWYKQFGGKTGASADGRKAGDYLSKNAGATVAQDRNGITALIASASKIDQTVSANGIALDVMFHPSAVTGEEGVNAMLSTTKTYFSKGGMAIQYNICDPHVLREAQIYPERYSTLQIRLCGWNVYFVDLSRIEQDEFITQAVH